MKNQNPYLFDIFSGCGGMSLGFQNAGFEVVAAFDNWKPSISVYQANFTEHPIFEDVDTVTLYINPFHQKEYYDYILSLHPKRIIFNPGTENDELASLAVQHNIKAEEACTLVLLGTGQY